MADPVAPAAPPTLAEVTANLTAARAVGGLTWRQQAQQYADAGVPLSSADKDLLASMNRSLPSVSIDAAMLHGGLSAADARGQAQGDRLMAAGRSLEETRGILGDPTFEPDTRSEAQRQYDARHGIAPVIDPRSYNVSTPPDETMASWQPVDADARSLAADLGYSPSAGANFINTVISAGTELGAAGGDAGMVRQRWEATLKTVYGDNLAAAERQVDALLKDYAGSSTMAAKLRDRGLLRNPTLFTYLLNRARAIETWLRDRPL